MKIIISLMLFSFFSFAHSEQWQRRWWGAVRIVDNHSFYANDQLIATPTNSIQALMGIVYYSSEFKVYKDCLSFEIPAQGEMGSIFVVTTSVQTPCEEVVVTGSRDGKILAKSLSFNHTKNKLTIQYTDEKFRTKELFFHLPLLKMPDKGELFQSSTQKKYGRSVILLTHKEHDLSQPSPLGTSESDWHRKDLVSCQTVSEDCSFSISTCDQCRYGYFEVPGGCFQGGPKFCGIDQCGRKGQPACRRGYLYQNGESLKMDCREDSSFGFCQKGLRIRCQGNLAICD